MHTRLNAMWASYTTPWDTTLSNTLVWPIWSSRATHDVGIVEPVTDILVGGGDPKTSQGRPAQARRVLHLAADLDGD
jgi:hypothetical protein